MHTLLKFSVFIILIPECHTHAVLMAELRLRLLSFPLPGGGRTSVAGPAGTLVGTLLAVGQGAGDLDPTTGVASHLPDRQAALIEGRHRRQDH
jgi:hypothetical protein